MPVTIKDIARKIGKSTTTVSRALHEHSDMSPETYLSFPLSFSNLLQPDDIKSVSRRL